MTIAFKGVYFMTGRDLIIYILQHDLEDEDIFKDGKFALGVSLEKAAEQFSVGVETIKAWLELGWLKGVKINDDQYVFPDVPVLKESNGEGDDNE